MEAPNSQDLKEEDNIDTHSRVKMEKNLASPDKAEREKAMSVLCRWLTSLKDIKEEGFLKIWEGLFYCLLHAEKEAVQAELIDRMANLLEQLDVEHSLLFFKVFLTALRREWGSFGEDRVDRFGVLLRHYVFHMFAVLQKSAWDGGVVSKFMDALVERALLAQDGIMADDVTIGIVSVFLHELEQYLPVPAGVFEALLEPFWMTLAKGGNNKMVAERIIEKIFLLLFDYGCRLLASTERELRGEEDVTCLGAAALSLSSLITKKSASLLPSASELNSVQLKLIQEKFMGLESLQVFSSCDSIGKNCSGNFDQADSQTNGDEDELNRLANSGGRAQICSISPLQFMVTRTFGRRSKRNQKLAFSPHTVDSVYATENVSSHIKPGNALEGFLVQEMDAGRGTIEDNMSSLSKTRELRKRKTLNDVISPDKSHMDMVVCAPQQNNDNGEIIDIDGSPPKQEATISEEEDPNGISMEGISSEDSVISNLTKRFESIAEQSPCLLSPKVFTPLVPSPINTGGRKRKSWRFSPMDALEESPTSTKENSLVPHDPCQGCVVSSIDNISAKKAKKVHFSLQHNIVWKPSTPLPPHSLRVPPSATPRGSALKKGVPPGPIVDYSENPSVSPKKKKKATPRKAPSAKSRSPKSNKNSAKVVKAAKRGRLSPR